MSLKQQSRINSRRAKKKFILQPNTSDCGVACLSSVLNYYGGYIDFELLRVRSGTTSQGTTLLGLQQAAESVGISAMGYRLNDTSDLKEADQFLIIPVTISGKMNHYYLLLGFENNKFILGDPATGHKKMTAAELEAEWTTKAVLALEPTEKIEQLKKKQKNKIQFVYSLLEEDLPYFGSSVFLGILISLLGISVASIIQRLVDQVIPLKNESNFISSVLTLAAVLFLRMVLTYARGVLINRQTKAFNIRMISGFIRKIVHLPKQFFNTRKTGDFVTRLNDTLRIQGYLNQLLGGLSIDLIVFVFSMTAIFFYNTQLMLLASACLLAYILISALYIKPLRKNQKMVMQTYSANESNYINTIQGSDDIIQFSKEELFIDRAVHRFNSYQNKAYKISMLNLTFRSLTSIVGILFSLTIIGFGSWLIFKEVIVIGEFLAILTLSNYILPAIERIIVSVTKFNEANIALDRILQVTDQSIDPSLAGRKSDSATDFESLAIEDLSFRFPGGKELYTNLNFNVEKNEWVAIMGDNGIGKSTLFEIILGEHQIQSGKIKLNGVPIENEYKNYFIQHRTFLVPQKVHLFDYNLLFNIVLSDDKEEIESAINLLNSYGFDVLFGKFPQGYHTILGEGGVHISAGQKQLIALARALVARPTILLLDEPFNFIDHETKIFIQELLSKLKKDITILMITHNEAVANLADRKLQLVNKELVSVD